ncbi:hypothetical protein GCM10023333_41110 [Ferrimonas pelagia]|uniref:Uncharacterized protein n=1 Tax=Ferrimonas pelagia TaxID=1177826 RepID=A0ABP9FIL9_9GAMM
MDNDYHRRSLSEAGVGRDKKFISPKPGLRDYDEQVSEALDCMKAMNRAIGLGMPVRQAVNPWKTHWDGLFQD